MKKVKCLIVMPRSYVGIDTIVPLLYCLKKQNWKIVCVFLNPKGFEILKNIPTYYKIIKENATIRNFKPQTKFSKILKLLYILLFIILTPEPRVIFSGGLDRSIMKIIKIFSKWKGIYYIVPNYNAPLPYRHLKEYYLDGLCDPVKRSVLGAAPGTFNAYSGKKLVGTLLLQSRYEDKRADLFGLPKNRIYMGHYKLREPWLKYVKENRYWGNEAMKKEKSYIVIITKKETEYLFDSKNEAQVLLKETIEHIRRFYKETLIVIKPKPFKTVEANDWIKDIVDCFEDKRLVIDFTPLVFTAPKTMMAIFNSPSTACFDFVINEVPCIEHARYGYNYYNFHPKGSYLSDFGVFKTSTVEELDNAISKVKNGTLRIMSRDSLKEHIRHENCEKVLGKL